MSAIAARQTAQPLRHAVLGNRLPRPGGITIGLIGRGIAASLSPLMHEEEGKRLGLDYRYHLIDFDSLGLDDTQLGPMIAQAQDLGFAGLNITYPFKQAVLPLLDTIAPEAAAIGAVNTIVLNSARTGHNTDCWGFAESFARRLPHAAKGRVLQLGAGGAGAAVAQALLQSGVAHLDIFDTDRAKAETLATRLQAQTTASVHAVSDITLARFADGLVNTTPVGMLKHPGLPLEAALIEPRHCVADVVYFPLETALLRLARERGCAVLPGGGMAVYQAVKAFELFSGIKPDANAMAATFARAIAV